MPSTLKIAAWNIQGDTFREGQVPYDLSGDFSANDNPHSVWTFGYSVEAREARVFIPFDRHSSSTTAAGVTQGWSRGNYNNSGAPAIWKNTSSQIQFGVAPGEISMHPGPRPNKDVSIVRFTAPANPVLFSDQNLAVVYRASGQFRAGDKGRMKASIWTRHANGQPDDLKFEIAETSDTTGVFYVEVGLASGDVLDFMVENNGDFSFGNTPLNLQIHATSLDEKIAVISQQLNDLGPDIVLLCEANRYFPLATIAFNRSPPPDQPAMIAGGTGLQHVETQHVTDLGVIGERVNSVLSRFPLGSSSRLPIMRGLGETKYAMTHTTANVNGVFTHIIALRFDAWSDVDNKSAHAQLSAIVGAIPSNSAVIIGGDFNAPKTRIDGHNSADFDTPWYYDFARTSGLTEFMSPGGIIDHIFFRGPFEIVDARLVPVPFAASDHGMAYAELRAFGPLISSIVPKGPIRVGEATTLTVNLAEQGSEIAVPDTSVLVDGIRMGATGSPFTHTFTAKVVRTRRINPRTHEVTWTSTYVFPDIRVATAHGYVDSVAATFTGMPPLPDPVDI